MEQDDSPLYQILGMAAGNGVYRLPDGGETAVRDAAEAHGYATYTVDYIECDEITEILEDLAQTMGFPEHFGGNLDALHDCLTDLSWQPEAGTVLVVLGLEPLLESDPDAAEALLEVLRSAAEFWAEEETPFWVFAEAPGIELPDMPTLE